MASAMRPVLASARSAALNASAVAAHGGNAHVRNAVNLSALKMRIRATNNVAKLTNVMKLVASSKLRAVEEALNRGRAFGESILNAIALKEDSAEGAKKATADEEAVLNIFVDPPGAAKPTKHLVVCITTDRGLCGSVNSSLARMARKEINAALKAKSDISLFVLGDKGRAQIGRDYLPIMTRTIDSYLDRDPIFPMAASIASKILAEPYDVLTLVYNHYENQVKFHNVYKKIPNFTSGGMPPAFKSYEVEPLNQEGETLANMAEYGVASAIYFAMLETQACETAQRVTAMDNASTNAKDMVDRFKLIYNRARQAKITTELTEIISGAESLQAATTSD